MVVFKGTFQKNVNLTHHEVPEIPTFLPLFGFDNNKRCLMCTLLFLRFITYVSCLTKPPEPLYIPIRLKQLLTGTQFSLKHHVI